MTAMTVWEKYKGLAFLALVVVAAPLFVWQYGVGDTVGKWRRTAGLRRQTEQLWAVQSQVAQSRAVTGAATSGREMILSGELVSELVVPIASEGLRIEHFSPYVTSVEDGVRLATGKLVVQGSFAGITRLLDHVETYLPDCKIVAAEFRSTESSGAGSRGAGSGSGSLGPGSRGAAGSGSGNSRMLDCTIYVQQITTN